MLPYQACAKCSGIRVFLQLTKHDDASLLGSLSAECSSSRNAVPLLHRFMSHYGLTRAQAAVAAGQAAGGGKSPAQNSSTPDIVASKGKDKAMRVSSGGGGGPGGAGALPVPLPAFGRDAREQLFVLDPEVSYLNHGSYGAAFR